MRQSKDDIAFFAANLGRTYAIGADATGVQLTDNERLPEGRYLIQLRTLVDDYVWITVRPFVAGEAVTAYNAPPAFPMSRLGLIAMEFHVRKGVNDRISARTSAGVATV